MWAPVLATRWFLWVRVGECVQQREGDGEKEGVRVTAIAPEGLVVSSVVTLIFVSSGLYFTSHLKDIFKVD